MLFINMYFSCQSNPLKIYSYFSFHICVNFCCFHGEGRQIQTKHKVKIISTKLFVCCNLTRRKFFCIAQSMFQGGMRRRQPQHLSLLVRHVILAVLLHIVFAYVRICSLWVQCIPLKWCVRVCAFVQNCFYTRLFTNSPRASNSINCVTHSLHQLSARPQRYNIYTYVYA